MYSYNLKQPPAADRRGTLEQMPELLHSMENYWFHHMQTSRPDSAYMFKSLSSDYITHGLRMTARAS